MVWGKRRGRGGSWRLLLVAAALMSAAAVYARNPPAPAPRDSAAGPAPQASEPAGDPTEAAAPPAGQTNAAEHQGGAQHAPASAPQPSSAGATRAPAAGASASAGQRSGQSINPRSGAMPTFRRLFMFSPYINGVIGGLSVIAVVLFFYFLLTINGRVMVPADLVDEVTKLVVRGKYEAAGDLCRANRRVFIATIVQRCVENAGRGHSTIMGMIETEGRRRADVVWNRISYLADVSNVAPMLGLLGTVLGMIQAFFGLEQESATVNARVLSQGVGQAMATTMFGLIVGIGALVFYSIVKARATRVLADAEQAVHAIADHMKQASGAAEPGGAEKAASAPSRREEDRAARTARAVVGKQAG